MLLVCGVLSLAGFIRELPATTWQTAAFAVGQGLIYALAYLCLRRKKNAE